MDGIQTLTSKQPVLIHNPDSQKTWETTLI
jgi:hypothetical protein